MATFHLMKGNGILLGLLDGACEQESVAITGVLDEKAAATQALGVYARETLAHYAPYIEQTLGVLLRMASYFHDDVREQAYEALSFLVAATTKAFPANAQGASHTCLRIYDHLAVL